MEIDPGEIVGMDTFVNALQDVIESSDLTKRRAFAAIIDAYRNDHTDEFQWATGAQAPVLLWNIMHAVELGAIDGEVQQKARVIQEP